MKKLCILSIVTALAMVLGNAPVAMAKGPVGDSVTIGWYEDATRYNPDGSISQSWANDGPFSAEFIRTGKAYHLADIQQYYNTTVAQLSGSLIISGTGKLSGHATYLSPFSGLPIRDRFHGEVNIDIDSETMTGNYTQWSYAFGSEEEVLSWYPNAVPDDEDCCWLLGYTIYTAH